MWSSDEILVEIEQVEHPDEGDRRPIVIVVVTVPIGTLSILGAITIKGRTLHIASAHVGGLHPGALGRAGLNTIGRKLLEIADVDQIVIQGSTRTTGRFAGKIPRPFCFPRSSPAPRS